MTVVDADADHIRAIAADGLTLAQGDRTSSVPVAAAVSPPAGPDSVGRVLLAVKAQATDRALEWVAPRLSTDGFVVSLQNGLNEDEIAAPRWRGTGRSAAFVNLFADVTGPGVIRDGGLGALVVGEIDGSHLGAGPVSRRRPAGVGSGAGPPPTSPATCGRSSASAPCCRRPRSPTPRWPSSSTGTGR